MQLKLLKEGDWAGIVTMAIGLSALQTVLEEGNKDDWFSSPFILRLAAVALVSLSLFVWIELTVEKPLIRLRLLKRRNFGFGTIAMTMLGFALFGSVYILPAYLGQAQGYNAEQIGAVMAWTGLPQLILIPLVPKLMQRFDTRYIAFTGLMIFAYSCFMNTAMSPDYAGDQLWIPNIVRAIGQAMVLTPLTSVTTGEIAPQDAAAASGISNMLRNLGGAIGTAVLATVITKREQFHSNIIGQSVTLGREEVRNRIAQMTDFFLAHGVPDPAAAHQQAIIALGNAVKHQALVMGFSDTFAVIGVVLVLAATAVAFTRKVKWPAAPERTKMAVQMDVSIGAVARRSQSHSFRARFLRGIRAVIPVSSPDFRRRFWRSWNSASTNCIDGRSRCGGTDIGAFGRRASWAVAPPLQPRADPHWREKRVHSRATTARLRHRAAANRRPSHHPSARRPARRLPPFASSGRP